MTISNFTAIFLGLLGIFLCIIVPTLLFLRQHAMKGDLSLYIDNLKKALGEYAKFCDESTRIVKKIADVEAELHAAKTRDISTQETIRNFGNKLNSRKRAERKDETTETDGKEEPKADANLEQMQMQFPGAVFPLPQQKPPVQSPPEYDHEFGRLP